MAGVINEFSCLSCTLGELKLVYHKRSDFSADHQKLSSLVPEMSILFVHWKKIFTGAPLKPVLGQVLPDLAEICIFW